MTWPDTLELLLSASEAAIPTKLFEYLPRGRPILCVTPKRSAVWRIGSPIPQVYCVDYRDVENETAAVLAYLAACASGDRRCQIPAEFGEAELSRIFLRGLGLDLG